MVLIKCKVYLTSLLVFVSLFGISLGGTVHQVGDSNGWTMLEVDYGHWATSRTFQVGDSLVFQYNNKYHDVIEVTSNDFTICAPYKPLARYQTGYDMITLTKPGVHTFICGFPGHCDMGQKVQIIVLPALSDPIVAPVSRPVQSPNSYSSPSPSSLVEVPVNNAPQYHMGPSPLQTGVLKSKSASWISLITSLPLPYVLFAFLVSFVSLICG